MKKILGIAFLMALMAGCSSTDTADTGDQNVVEDTPPPVVDTPKDDKPSAPDQTVFYFDFDQSLLKPEARQALIGHAAFLSDSPRSIRLEGHADERGSREYNMALGERRANAVRDFLILQGVSASMIETVSYGEERPAVLGETETAWAQNRRVELK